MILHVKKIRTLMFQNKVATKSKKTARFIGPSLQQVW